MESTKPEYFIDGFLIRHFNIFPLSFDKENLFEEQKIFLIYLLGTIPDIEQWRTNVEYKLQLNKIRKLKNIELTDTEKDVATLQGRSLSDVKKEKLLSEKKKRLQELNKKFGVREESEDEEKVVERKAEFRDNNPTKLWELLQGKGLIK